jgi:hypothetical protein
MAETMVKAHVGRAEDIFRGYQLRDFTLMTSTTKSAGENE